MLKCDDMEIHLVHYFGARNKLIVPNVSWGLGIHECDLVVMSRRGYLTEVEIKTSKSDLRADQKKRHNHKSDKIKYLIFAIPEQIPVDYANKYVPERAGILVVHSQGSVELVRRSEPNRYAVSLTIEKQYQLARLAAIKLWATREKVWRNNK